MGAAAETTVLVTDDEEPVVRLFEDALDSHYEVRTATEGNEALEKLDESVDVLLLDRRMPDVSGDWVLEEIEAQGLNCHVAIVTAVEPDFDVIDMGFDDYLTKPVSPAEVQETVDRLLSLSEYEEKYQELGAKRVKKNILEVEKSEGELQSSERFARLQERIDELESQLEEIETDENFDDRLLPT